MLIKADAKVRVAVHDGWVEVRQAISIGDVLAMVEGGSMADLQRPTPATFRRMMHDMILGWSYDEPVSPEAIDSLDIKAAGEVMAAISTILNGDVPEKKEVNGQTPSPEGVSPSS